MQYEPVFFDIETTGLNPMAQDWWSGTDHAAQVTAVGIGWLGDWREGQSLDDVTINQEVYSDRSEYQLLGKIAGVMEARMDYIEDDDTEPILVTFNGRQYDHPYLGARFARLRLDGSVFNSDYKRLDMMRALGTRMDGVGRYPSEDDCLDELGLGSDDPYDGSDMPEAFAEGDMDAIRTHVRHDVAEMLKLFVETKELCMEEFYQHYGIDKDANFVEEVEP